MLEFGCPNCYGDDPLQVEQFFRRARFERIEMLVDDVHFIVRLLACPECGQDFISVFTERIDWVGGDDPQTRTLMPLTPSERSTIAEALDPSLLLSWGAKRRYHLWTSWGASCWRTGGYHIPPHD